MVLGFSFRALWVCVSSLLAREGCRNSKHIVVHLGPRLWSASLPPCCRRRRRILPPLHFFILVVRISCACRSATLNMSAERERARACALMLRARAQH
jgi:hypothetical protein